MLIRHLLVILSDLVLNSGNMLSCSRPLPVGSKSDGQKSPSDSVFLRMDEIPYRRTECLKAKGGTGGWTYHHLLLRKHDIILFFLIFYMTACATLGNERRPSNQSENKVTVLNFRLKLLLKSKQIQLLVIICPKVTSFSHVLHIKYLKVCAEGGAF